VLCPVTGNQLNGSIVSLKWDSEPDNVVADLHQLLIVVRDISFRSRLIVKSFSLLEKAWFNITWHCLHSKQWGWGHASNRWHFQYWAHFELWSGL